MVVDDGRYVQVIVKADDGRLTMECLERGAGVLPVIAPDDRVDSWDNLHDRFAKGDFIVLGLLQQHPLREIEAALRHKRRYRLNYRGNRKVFCKRREDKWRPELCSGLSRSPTPPFAAVKVLESEIYQASTRRNIYMLNVRVFIFASYISYLLEQLSFLFNYNASFALQQLYGFSRKEYVVL
jgi:hypothetical protein